jgi:hypothetical protein
MPFFIFPRNGGLRLAFSCFSTLSLRRSYLIIEKQFSIKRMVKKTVKKKKLFFKVKKHKKHKKKVRKTMKFKEQEKSTQLKR